MLKMVHLAHRKIYCRRQFLSCDVGDINEHKEFEDLDTSGKGQKKNELLYVGKEYGDIASFERDLYQYCHASYTHVRKVY